MGMLAVGMPSWTQEFRMHGVKRFGTARRMKTQSCMYRNTFQDVMPMAAETEVEQGEGFEYTDSLTVSQAKSKVNL